MSEATQPTARRRAASRYKRASKDRCREPPTEIAKKLQRYPLIPATLLGRLAVDERHHGKGLGQFLLMDALRSMVQSVQIAAAAVVVDAIPASQRVYSSR
jgi:predicted GNAT family N-acyltransferase